MKTNLITLLTIGLMSTNFSCFSQEEPEMIIAKTMKVNASGIDPAAQKKYNDAISALEGRNYSEAYDLFTSAIAIAPEFTKAYINRGYSLVNLNRKVEAKEDYLKAVSIDKTLHAVFYELGVLSAENDSIKDAINFLEKAIALQPNEKSYRYQLGVYHFLNASYEQAIECFSKVITTDPKFAKAYNDRAAAYKELGKTEKAINDFKQAIKIQPNLGIAHSNLGALYRKEKNYAEAIRYYSQALDLDQHNLWVRNNRALTFFEQGDYVSASNDLSFILELDPENVFALNNLAGIALKNKKYQEAVDYATKAVTLNSSFGQSYLNRGIAYEMLRNETAACENWKMARDLGVDIADSYFQRTNCSTLISE